MSLQEAFQIIGGVGVIASLFYVAIQIRANARAVRAQTYQQLTSTVLSGWNILAGNGELTDILLRGLDSFDSLSRLEKARFRFLHMSFVRVFENAWFQHKIGTLQEGDWKAFAGDMDSVFSAPGARAAWPLIKNRSNPEFRDYVEEVIKRQVAMHAAKIPASPPGRKPKTASRPRKGRLAV